jgi:hypothetical protein
MDCQETRKAIPEYVEHTISEEVTNSVEEHLCVCPSCRDFLSQCIDKVAGKDLGGAPEVKPKPQSQPKPVSSESVVEPKPVSLTAPEVTQPENQALSESKFGPFEIGIMLVGLGVLLFLASLLLKK